MKYLKKIIMGSFLIYAFNMIAINFNIVIPINIWTIAFISIFDFPALAVILFVQIIGL